MGSAARLFAGVPGAMLVTGVLLLFMAAMIRQDLRLIPAQKPAEINITREIKDSPIERPEIVRPDLKETPPPPLINTRPTEQPRVDHVPVDVPEIDGGAIAVLPPDRNAQPLVRIPPQYPDRCQARAGATESVALEFDVTPDGQTANIRVVDSTNGCFDSAAMRSVERWKYQPKIVDGQAQWRRGVRTSVTFELTE